MCGIAGTIRLDGEKADRGLLERMIDRIRYRGPDETGFFIDENAGMAHARLSIIDLSTGSQPIHNEDKTLWIVFNGEIYNYVELRKSLVERGHRFTTKSDTEVIVHLYEEKGEDCVNDFNGQWAFAIWDTRKRKIFLSRDRLGIRPLFYTVSDKAFLFSSEIKSLFAAPEVRRELDPRALDQIFTFWVTIPPKTAFKGIRELPPGHSMTMKDGDVKVRPYWKPDFSHIPRKVDDNECVDRLRSLLIDSTRLRLRSDVPVGAYLSGGLDSSVTTALIRKFSDSRLSSFSIVFDDAEFDESGFQRDVIDMLRTDHREICCSATDIGGVFPDVIWHSEKPVVRTAPAPLYLLSRLVRDSDYKVVLTGEGSDEILGGYDLYKEAKIRRFWGAYPDSKIRPLLLKRLYPYLQNIQAQPEAYLKAFFHVRPDDLTHPFFSHLPRWEMTSKLKIFFSDRMKSELNGYNAYEELENLIPNEYFEWDGFCRAQFLESTTLLPGYILSSQGDRMAMAHSVEGRFPFLDHRVVEFAASLPPRLKMKALNEKFILKRAAEDLIPASVGKRPKQPYRAPEAVSFIGMGERSNGRDYVEELLSRKRIDEAGIFNASAVEKLIGKIKRRKAIGIKDNMALVGILSTQLLLEQFVTRLGKISNHGKD